MTKEEQFLNEVKLLTDKIAQRITADAHANFVELYDEETGLTSWDIKQIALNQVNRQLAQELYLNLSK
jgi:hypothetical protein